MSQQQPPGAAQEGLGGVDLARVECLLGQEMARFESSHPGSMRLYERGLRSWLYGAPMHWMQQWPGSCPISVAEAVGAHLVDVDGNEYVDFALGDTAAMFGHGGTLAGSALQMAAVRATLEHVMTEEVFTRMAGLAERMEAGILDVLTRRRLPWHVTRIGARVEYLFSPRAPRTGGEAHKARHALLEAYIHLYLLNRGVLLTPFHNMALMCPFTTEEDVDRHDRLLDDCLAGIVQHGRGLRHDATPRPFRQ